MINGVAVLILWVGMTGGTMGFSQDDDLNQLVATEKAFAATAHESGVKQAFLKYFTEDGIVFQPGPVKAREFWAAQPDTSALLAWSPVWADISNTGQLGYTTGPWEFKPTGMDGTAIAFGQFITVWKKQTDGTLRVVLDIGISHEIPAATSDDWSAPKRNEATSRLPVESHPSLDFLRYEQCERLFGKDVRLYRHQKFPFIGKVAALQQILEEQKVHSDGQAKKIKCDRDGDLAYCYGILELSGQDGSMEKKNLLRIFKYRNDTWQIVLEVVSEAIK